jgi:hypothetical protein
MGYKMQEACEPVDASPTQKAVLMALAYRYNDDDGRCYPSVKNIMKFTCLSNRAVADALAGLEEAGHITVHRRNGAGSSYELHPKLPCKPVSQTHRFPEKPVSEVHGSEFEPVSQTHGLKTKPVNLAPKPVSLAHTNRSNRIKNNSSENLNDPRHHEITSQWSGRFEAALGYKPTFCTRGARELQKLLPQISESSDEFFTVAEKAWGRQREDLYASACKKSVTLEGLCINWTPIRAEIQRPDAKVSQQRTKHPFPTTTEHATGF